MLAGAYGNDDIVIVHDALGFGGCHLSVAIPQAWGEINSMRELMALPKWGPSRPLRVVTRIQTWRSNSSRISDSIT